MTIVKDRCNEPANDKYVQDKLRYIAKHMDRVRQALSDKIANDSLDEIGKGGMWVPVLKSTTHEPFFHHAKVENFHRVFPGNVRLEDGSIVGSSFDVGDRIRKGGGGGSGGRGTEAGDGEGEDDFIWINEDDFKSILFEGRSLPDMTKLTAAHVDMIERRRAGYTNKGPAHRMDMQRTDKKRRDEELVLSKTSERRILENLSEQYNIITRQDEGVAPLDFLGATPEEKSELAHRALHLAVGDGLEEAQIPQNAIEALTVAVQTLKTKLPKPLEAEDQEYIEILENRLNEQFKIRSQAGDFRDRHLTFEYDDDFPKPSVKAVMFCQMDISGSMGQEEKNNAKVFFWLLKEFLQTAYEKVDIVFIAHTTVAAEVDEQEFFYGKETGGTLVSPCLQLTKEIIEERYPPSEWNIYSAQVSDGDNEKTDNSVVYKLMEELLPILQSHYYVEVSSPIRPASTGLSELGRVYKELSQKHEGRVHVAGGIRKPKDSLEAFKHFFPVGGKAPAGVYSPGM